MAGSKQTPRQKMINMMYLVLTAMLALNVTSEVLNAFKTVDDGIGRSNHSLQVKTAGLFNAFNTQMGVDAKKTEPYKLKAQEVRKVSMALYDRLEAYKQQVIKEAGGFNKETGQLISNDNIDIATRIFVEEKHGKELKEDILRTSQQLLAIAPESERRELEAAMPLLIEEPKDAQSWEFHKFNHVPTVAAVTLLSKYQNDILATENQLVEHFYKQIDAASIKVDKMTALVSAPSSYIMQGLSYKANIMLTAYSSTENPDVFLGTFTGQVKKNAAGMYEEINSPSENPPLTNARKVDVADGLGKIQMQGGSVGESRYTGVIRVKDPSGNGYKFYPFEGEYQVAAKSAVVSPTAMNVLYEGLDNPLSVSVPGVAQRDVVATYDGPGVLSKQPDGSYSVKPAGRGNFKVKITAKVDGNNMPMGEVAFRVKRVPDPQPTLDGLYSSGNMSAAKFKATSGVVPKLTDFVFDKARFDIISYKIVFINADGEQIFSSTQAQYDPKFKTLVEKGRVKKGCTVVFEDIYVRDPAGQRRQLTPIAIAINS
ncbi:MAG: gliding motility protein GldM [Bacteroidetes bacterium]|nr:gliding motility protein GldM [Bacteroidota bacterium]